MKRVLFLLVFFVFILTSCSVSEHPELIVQSETLPLISSEQVLLPKESLLSGKSYFDLSLNSEVIKIGDTSVVLPEMPSQELADFLICDIEAYLNSLELPLGQKVLDFHYDEGFSTRTFTFYLSDSSDFYNLPNLHFSYNVETLKRAEISDFFESDELLTICNELYGVEEITVDSFAVSAEGVTLFSNGNPLFIEAAYVKRDPDEISVFYPNDYHPVTDPKEKYVAITFDDGPNPYSTPGLLDMLDKKGVKATFFMIGYNIEEYGYIVKKVYNGGHDIGIHSYGHSNYLALSPEEIINDLDKCSNMIYSIVGKRPYLVRPPFGNIDISKIDTEKYFFVNWNVDPLDWQYDSPEVIANEALKYIRSGSIILLHDIYKTSCEAAEIIIDKLLKDGYRFVTLSEYFDLDGKKTDNKLHFFLEDYNVE